MIGQPAALVVRRGLPRLLLRPLSTTTTALRGEQTEGKVHPGYLKIRETYKRFQVDDGTPVHLKGGPFDKILYSVTIAMVALGLVGCLEYYYTAAYPPKNK